ncbi:molybdenum cofactor guanylyltransferase [Halobacteriaceae archaeon SHR40]|uniref:molybdenum cofactor guanylyltransferase n=1 Tax=Halovenus amylolytica TaxID=2500550 RepID=UPI000FE36E9F
MHSGVIIAGGRSTRFGETDKALADLAGTPMIRRVADRIDDIVGELIVNCRPEQTDPIREAMAGYSLPVSYAEDEVPDRGPVAGIRNGLDAASGEFAFVVACDMPFVDPALVAYLFDSVAGHEAAVPRLDSEWFQTTQAVYHADAMAAACDDAFERENPRILDPLETLDYTVIEEAELEAVTDLDSFENVNTRAELEAAADRLRE